MSRKTATMLLSDPFARARSRLAEVNCELIIEKVDAPYGVTRKASAIGKPPASRQAPVPWGDGCESGPTETRRAEQR
jgi:hypothetical protein